MIPVGFPGGAAVFRVPGLSSFTKVLDSLPSLLADNGLVLPSERLYGTGVSSLGYLSLRYNKTP